MFFNFTWMSHVFFCVFAKPWELSLLLITLVYFIAEPLSCGINMCAQSCLTLWDPMDCSLPGSSIHGSFQERILKQVAVSSSRGSSWTRDGSWVSWVSCIGRWILSHWAILEAPWYKYTTSSILLRWMFELF